MSARIDFVPRFDSGAKFSGTTFLNLDKLGLPGVAEDGVSVRFDSLGTELVDDEYAKVHIGRKLAERWGLEPSDRRVQDAAGEFVTGPLERVLGPSADVVRGRNKPYVFVPGEGRTPAVPSRNELPPGWEVNSYEVKSYTGQAAWTEPHATKHLPTADFLTEKKLQGAKYYGIRYRWSIPEEWSDRVRRINSQAERELAAIMALDDFREAASKYGAPEFKLPGVYRSGDALKFHGGARFGSGTVDAPTMMLRLASWAYKYSRCNERMEPTRVIAPLSDKVAMQRTYFTGTSDTVWSRAIEDFPWLQNAVWDDSLVRANSAGNGPRWVFLTDDPLNMYIEHTDTMVFGPFPDEMDMSFVLLRRHGGFVNRLPERLAYVDFT